MTAHRSLRSRVAMGIALLVILVLTIHSIALYVVTERREEDQIDRVVTEEIETVIARYRRDPTAALASTRNLMAYVVRDGRAEPPLPPVLQGLSAGLHEVFEGEREWHVAVRDAGGVRFYLAYDATPHEEELRAFFRLLIFGVVITAAAAGWLGYVAAGLLTRPVSDLAQRVGSLDPAAAAAPLAPRYRDLELRRLAQAFDEYSARMVQFIARERQFTADVSHEFRTPLTSIRTGSELLGEDARLHPELRPRVARIARAAEQMTALMQSLLLLARAGQPAPPESFPLRECVEDAVEPLRERLAGRGIEWRNEVEPVHVVHTDRAALTVVLSNLLRNAADFTHSGYVAVRLTGGAVEVEDTGTGIESQDLPHVFDRFYRGCGAKGREGFGLGLAIVKRIAEQHGWGLSLQSEPARGTRVRLKLAADRRSSVREAIAGAVARR